MLTVPDVHLITTDILIIGSGGSGLRAAIAATEAGARVLLVAKELLKEAHTSWAMGGINVAIKHPATPAQHFEDTINGGWRVNNYRLARIFAQEMPERVRDMEKYGVRFDRLPDGAYFTWASGKQSVPLNLCAGDYTGREMMQGLLAEIERLRIPYLEHHYVSRLIKQAERVAGAFLIDTRTGTYHVVQAQATVVATGGGGCMYRVNTNAPSNTGEGYAWGLDAGAQLVDMEFVQFHPTGMAWPPEKHGTLVTEKVRGNGGILKNTRGERFMTRYQPERLELAGRDEVARAIYQEIEEGRGTEHNAVYLDITHWEEGKAERLVPDVLAEHLNVGIDIRRQMMEITPSMHHMMGGFVINEWGETTVPGLYATGEVTASVHGANRLGGNSLAEGQVFGRRTGIRAASFAASNTAQAIPRSLLDAELARIQTFVHQPEGERPAELLAQIQQLMWDNVGIIRSAEKLQAADLEIKTLQEAAHRLRATNLLELQSCLEIQDMLRTARAIIVSACVRTESRGAHYRSDYPHMDTAWEKNIRIWQDASGHLATRVVDVIK
jgi:succinate dehydrogenase/fumarate reductase flavoprotein subunit